jgi:predicted HAD superfamily Cof-like phosphohydrolase
MPAKIQCPVVMFSIASNLLSLKHKIEQMKKQLNHVEKFHDTFGIPNEYTPKATISNDLIDLRFKLMAEENEEYLEAAKNGDLVEVADALGDMMYILCGTILSHGMQHKIEEVFEEIQRSNMSKLGEDGKPIYREDGKVLKGPNYFKPNIAKIIEG